MKRLLLPVVLLLLGAVAGIVIYRAVHKPRQWPTEPEAFLNIRLGVPLVESIHPCDQRAPAPGPCFEELGGHNTVQNVDGYWEISIDALDRNVNGITAYYERDSGTRVRTDLVRQYGQPHRHTTDDTGDHDIWTGDHVTLTFYNNPDGTGFVAASLNDHHYRPPSRKQ
ncbi:MAG TPA: hypothetical protein VGC07_09560 [Granulicella sp.]